MFRIHSFILLLSVLGLSRSLQAQEFSTIDQSLIWIGATGKLKFNKGWEASLKLQERRYIFPDRGHQRVLPDIRFGKSFSDKNKLSAGLFVFRIAQPQTPFEPVGNYQHELRPYLTWEAPVKFLSENLSSRVMWEFRIFKQESGGYGDMLNRFRWKLQYTEKLSSRFALALGEEILLNGFWQESVDIFDQNRLTADLKTKLSDRTELSTGYLYWFQPSGGDQTYFSRHILTIGFTYTFSFAEAA